MNNLILLLLSVPLAVAIVCYQTAMSSDDDRARWSFNAVTLGGIAVFILQLIAWGIYSLGGWK